MELNRDEIIKALECCSSSDGVIACESGCPYWGGDYDTCPCTEDPNFIIKNALALIKELTQAHKMLSESYDHLEKTKDELLAERSRLSEENERLKDELAKRPPKLVITKVNKESANAHQMEQAE